MDFPQEGEDAVGGNQTGRAACTVSSHVSLKKEEPVTDGHQGVSTGRVLSYIPQTHRPVSPVPSCVSMKSDWSMGRPVNFSSGPPQSDQRSQSHRPVSPVPSCVSMKSDWSMGRPVNFSSGPPQSDQRPQSHRPVSPVPSCVSMKSDWSMGHPVNFSSGPPQSDQRPQTHRPVSMKSDWSMGHPPEFSIGQTRPHPKPQTHRSVSPVPSCVSMKSDWSMGHPPEFSNGPPLSHPYTRGDRPQTHRPVSPVPSGVSMKSDWSMGHPPEFSIGQTRPHPKPQTHRSVSPVPSYVSMKSDWSMGHPPEFSNGPPQPHPYTRVDRPQTHRSVSPVPSGVSMKSDWSMGHPPEFSNGQTRPHPKNILTQDQSKCGVCEQLLRDPVITSCGHSFCRQCISTYWSQSGPSGDYSCPQCRKRPRTQPIINPDTAMGQPYLYLSTAMAQPHLHPSTAMAQPHLYPPSTMAQPHLYPSTTMAQPHLYPSTAMAQPHLYPPTAMAQPHLYPPTAMAQPHLYPSAAMAQPHLYPSTTMAQPSSYQHSEMALHLNPYTDMAQVPPYPHTDTEQRPQYSNSAMGQHNHYPDIQPPLYPHIHTAQISPQPPLDEHTVMTGSSTLLQTEHAPVKRAKLTDDDVLTRVLMTHKASMKRRFESICEGIIRSGTQTLLNKIYTELYITEGESEGVNNEHEVWQVESASRSQTTEDTAINCNDIFKPLPGQERHIRTVMTKGIAGIGKTVSVQKFILDWAEERANQDVDFMFVLPFRELNLVKHDQYSLHRLLLEFHPELRELQDGEYKDCHVVFVFDGLDESRLPLNFQKNQKMSDVTQTSSVDVLMTSLIQRTLLSSALIWITSRPAATSQIPSQCISQVTEVRGFNDPQKEEYFRKRISDQNQANRIISHITATRSLHIMCHMPVFCWISATVLQQMLEQDDGKEAPKTLTEMFIHFLLIQTTRKNQKYQEESETNRQRLLESHKGVILKLAELAFKHLENGNLMFYEEDLRECGIDVSEASVYSGMCTEIFREECVFFHKKVYCFVHLSIQEFLAALHLFASFLSKNMKVLKPFIRRKSRSLPDWPLDELLKNAVNKALESKNGHLDLFVRFLHGISLVSNQRLLLGLLAHTHSSPESVKKTIKNLKVMQRPNISPERCINLFHCLVEMHDSSVHDEIQAFLKAEKGAVKQLTLAHCSALAHVLLMSDEVLDEFDLSKYKTSPEGRRRLVPAVRCCRKALLNLCHLSKASCEMMASVLQSAPSHLRELDMSGNDLQDEGVELLCAGLRDPQCKLETLRLNQCHLSKASCEMMASVLQRTPSHLRELDMSDNDLQDEGVKLLCVGLSKPQCKLETLRLAGCKLTEESCKAVASALQSSISLKELDLSHNDLKESGVQLLSTGLSSPHCKLTTLRLNQCHLSKASCEMMASVLQRTPSHLRELDMSDNDLPDEGVELLCAGLRDPQCKLETLRLNHCKLSQTNCQTMASVLQGTPSHLRELDMSDNDLQDEGVKLLCAGLRKPQCKLETLRLNQCHLSKASCEMMASVLQRTPSHLRELDMSGIDLQDEGVNLLFAGLRDPQCKLETLRLAGCKLTEESCKAVASALQSSISLKELDLSHNDLKESGVQLLSTGLSSPHCKLQTLRLNLCHLSKASCEMMASVLQSAPSHLRELDMSDNDLQDEGVELFCAGLRDPQCKLETLRLSLCLITHEGCSLLSSALKSNPSYLKQLDLSYNHPGDPGVRELTDRLNDPSCKLETLR
ncbi:NACHT, LRR and PYD domains-containing protein 12-like [Sardina pilchardus]|uniref:NACHT, LRR and PYD domains-containing protein 12-like n=1 Tax=Sardina pilchardus TaxID=27697 RepID=UPI002E0DBBBE